MIETETRFGRRACVGKHVANDSLFMSMATVLWVARLECPRDESGKEFPLDTETTVDGRYWNDFVRHHPPILSCLEPALNFN